MVCLRASPRVRSPAASVSSFTALLLSASSANAQLQQPFVYTTGGAIATRDDATGVLAPTAASPLAVLGFPAVLDAKGRFLFAAGNNSIHMYQVDSVTGSLHRSLRLTFRFDQHQLSNLDCHRTNRRLPPAFSITSPSTALSATVSAGQSATYALQLTPGLDFNGTISFTCTGAPLNATCQAPPSMVLNVGAPAAFTVTVATSGAALVAPEITPRRSPRTPASPGAIPSAFALALGTLLFILFLRLYRESGGSAPTIGVPAWYWRITYAMVALMILLPLLFAADGCGGASTPAPTAQKSSLVTPSGTSTLVITPTATNASGKALQMPLIQLTLTVN